MKNKKLFHLVFILLSMIMMTSCHTGPQIILPQDWRTPLIGEIGNDWREKDASRFLSITGDFNGDGNSDQANILVREDKEKIGLFVFLKSKKGYKIYTLSEMDFLYTGEAGITLIPPGKYVTWCGMGAIDCGLINEPEEIDLRYDSINLFFEGKGSQYYYYDKSSDTFKRVAISD